MALHDNRYAANPTTSTEAAIGRRMSLVAPDLGIG
jgi:hypothetical protein